jgi:methionine aminopeptidase
MYLGQQHRRALFTSRVCIDSILQLFWCDIFPINRSDPEASRVLAKDDIVKIQLGAHIDGYASITAETIVIGTSAENPVTGRRADVIKAAWTAAEAAMRTVKAGNKNWAVTDVVGRCADAFACKPVEGRSLDLRLFISIDIRLQVCFLANRHKALSMARNASS